MHVVILGAGGFLGKRLAQTLLKAPELTLGNISQLTLVDVTIPDDMPRDPRVRVVKGDFSEVGVIEDIFRDKPALVFHLAAVVSGEAEKNFDLGMRVNFYGSLQMLELCRKLAFRPRIVFASSCAVFGGDVNKAVEDDTASRPRSSYGTQKAMVDLLLNDYSRRGFVDARSLRLPTIAVRPGRPNAATSSFLSSIIREPLNGKKATYPVNSENKFWLLSPRRVIDNFIHAANISEEALGKDRIINLPGITVSVQELLDSLAKVAGKQAAGLVSYEPDEFLQSIVLTWPPYYNTTRARSLGFKGDNSALDLVKAYIEEENIAIPQLK